MSVSRRARSTALCVARRSAVFARRLGLRRTAPAADWKLPDSGVGSEPSLDAGDPAAAISADPAKSPHSPLSGIAIGGVVGDTEPVVNDIFANEGVQLDVSAGACDGFQGSRDLRIVSGAYMQRTTYLKRCP